MIAIEGLCKSFGATKALDGLDLVVQPGEVMGFLGPNGSGKSTAIRVLMGLLRHDAGSVTLFGQDPWQDAVELHRRVAYVPGDVNLWPGLSGGETIDLLARLGSGLDLQRRAEMIDRFDFDPTKKASTYSKGNRQKVALIAALGGNAELLILDEPTSGLDPLMEAEFQQVVRELVDTGKTVLLSSHILAEVESLGDRVTIIRDGRTVETGTLTDLRRLTSTRITATTAKPIAPIEDLAAIEQFTLSGPNHASFVVSEAGMSAVMAELAALGIESLVSQPPTLAELFMRHYATDSNPDGATDTP